MLQKIVCFYFPERVLRATHQQSYQKGMQKMTINDLKGELKHPRSYAITRLDYPGCPRTSQTSRTSRTSRTSWTSRASRDVPNVRPTAWASRTCRDVPRGRPGRPGPTVAIFPGKRI